MKSISQQTENDILTPLDQATPCGKSAPNICVHYSTVIKLFSQHHFTIPKAQGGWPYKLNSTPMDHAISIISTGRAEIAAKVANSLQETFPELVPSQAVQRSLIQTGIEATEKPKRPALPKWHCREWLDLSKSYQNWAGRVLFGQTRPNSIIWGQMRGSGHGRRAEKPFVTGWLREPSSLEVCV